MVTLNSLYICNNSVFIKKENKNTFSRIYGNDAIFLKVTSFVLDKASVTVNKLVLLSPVESGFSTQPWEL